MTGELLDGTSFDLADWRGQVVVVNWWGSWCAPCRAEHQVAAAFRKPVYRHELEDAVRELAAEQGR